MAGFHTICFLFAFLGKVQGERLIWFADVHADPYYGTPDQQGSCDDTISPFGGMGCDPPYALFESAVEAAAGLDLDPDAVLFTGDFTRHDQNLLKHPWRNVTDIIGNVTATLTKSFPEQHAALHIVVGALGNDDSIVDYLIEDTTGHLKNAWLEAVAGRLAEEGTLLAPEMRGLAYGGAFVADVGGLTLLTINTIIYSIKREPMANHRRRDPFNQFKWLRRQLRKAADRGRKVWIVGHIAPGIETYGYTELWSPMYVEQYLAIVQDEFLGPVIAAQLFGHVHADEFRVLPNPAVGTGPILLSGAVSPIYWNNPSFRVVEYDSSGDLINYKAYYAELDDETLVWRLGYDAKGAFPDLSTSDGLHAIPSSSGVESHRHGSVSNSAITMASYMQLARAMENGQIEGGWEPYIEWYKMKISNDLETCATGNAEEQKRCQMDYMCAVTVRTQKSFDSCASYSVTTAAAVSSKPLRNYVSEGDIYSVREQYHAARDHHQQWIHSGIIKG